MIGKYVIITNPERKLYRRRCKVIDYVEGLDVDKWQVYSEGLEETEYVYNADFEESKY